LTLIAIALLKQNCSIYFWPIHSSWQLDNHLYLQSYRINRYFCDHYYPSFLQKLIHKIFTVDFQASLRYSSHSFCQMRIERYQMSNKSYYYSCSFYSKESHQNCFVAFVYINMPLKYMTCCLVSIEFRLQMLGHLA
jgi:hypothetical protein